MQNKANWKLTQMFVTKTLTTNYNRMERNERKKTKPIDKCYTMTINILLTNDYED